MSKPSSASKINLFILWPFVVLVFAVLLTPFWVFTPLLFPFITSKAFYFRAAVELALPFYLYMIAAFPQLRPSLRNKLTWTVLAFLAISFISAFFGQNVTRSLWGNFERMGGVYYQLHLSLVYFYMILLAAISQKFLQRFLQALIAVSVILSLNGTAGKLGFATLTLDPSLPDRASSTFGNPIFFASFLILPLAFSVYFALRAGNWSQKTAYGAASFLILTGIFLSGTRGSAVGLILSIFAGAVIFLLTAKNSRVKFRTGLGLSVVAVVVAAGLLMANKLPEGSTLRRVFKLNDSNSQARLIQWRIALRGFKLNPILGVGPENYYVIAQKFNDPAINKYDASWFDKPHNFYLEVLDTAGALGFLAYLAILAGVLLGLWRAFRLGMVSAGELAVLSAGFLAYLFQNVFVFDTASPSVVFFIFCGVAGYFLDFSNQRARPQAPSGFMASIAGAVLIAASLAVAAAVYYTNWLPIMAARDTNFGYAYGTHRPQIAIGYFAGALNNPMNFDPATAVNRYSEFAEELLKTQGDKDPRLVVAQLKESFAWQKKITEKTGNDALLWMRLGADDIILSLAEGRPIGQSAENSMKRAVDLAPDRVEPWQALLQLYSYRKDWVKALPAAEKMAEINSYNPKYKVLLAQVLHQNGKDEEAVKIITEALREGYKFEKPQEFLWLIEYYQKQNNFSALAGLYEEYLNLEPGNIGAYLDLVQIYIKLGDKDHARVLLETLLLQNPNLKGQLGPLLSQLK